MEQSLAIWNTKYVLVCCHFSWKCHLGNAKIYCICITGAIYIYFIRCNTFHYKTKAAHSQVTPDRLIAVVSVLGRSAGANQFWHMGHGRVVRLAAHSSRWGLRVSQVRGPGVAAGIEHINQFTHNWHVSSVLKQCQMASKWRDVLKSIQRHKYLSYHNVFLAVR